VPTTRSLPSPGAVGRKPASRGANNSTAIAVLGGCVITLPADATIDAVIRAIAGRQRGRAARWQLSRAGIRPGAIDRRIKRGSLIRVHPGVYVVAPAVEVPFAAETEALLAAGPGGVLSHHSAAVLWDLRPGAARPVHVTVPEQRSGPRMGDLTVHRSRTLARGDVRYVHGLPATSPARTLLDVAGTRLDEEDVARLVDEALFVRRIVTRAQLWAAIRRAGGHPGVAKLTRVLAARTRPARPESHPERRLLELIRAAGLPEPETQVEVLGYRVDFLWREQGVAVEVDAYGTHGSPRRFEQDRRRDAEMLTRARIATLRVTGERIQEQPFAVVSTLTRAVCR
jgi:very-short-patch-repair endonuclease